MADEETRFPLCDPFFDPADEGIDVDDWGNEWEADEDDSVPGTLPGTAAPGRG